jgi:ADP-heptose:LPS heptosyltransferase
LIAAARVRGRRNPLPEKSSSAQVLQYEMMLEALKKGLRQHLPIELQDELVTANPFPKIPIKSSPDSTSTSWQKELRFGTWLAIAPGASTPTKKAPSTTFLSTIQKIKKQITDSDNPEFKSLGLVMLGDESDIQATRSILDSLNWQDPVLNLSGKLSLWESALALKEATCLLSNDSSLGHIAEAVGTPSAILFGPTIESFGFTPRLPKSRAFSIPLGCRPCSKHGKANCRFGDHLCFHSLPIDSIADHLFALLNAGNVAP